MSLKENFVNRYVEIKKIESNKTRCSTTTHKKVNVVKYIKLQKVGLVLL